MVLNNVTQVSTQTAEVVRQMYVSTYGRTGVTLNAPGSVMVGHKKNIFSSETFTMAYV